MVTLCSLLAFYLSFEPETEWGVGGSAAPPPKVLGGAEGAARTVGLLSACCSPFVWLVVGYNVTVYIVYFLHLICDRVFWGIILLFNPHSLL